MKAGVWGWDGEGRNKLQKGVIKKKKAKCAGVLAARGPTFQETFMVHVDRPGEKEKKEWE